MGNFRELKTWQKAMTLAESVYAVTESMNKSERFNLISQMRRSAVSIASNIAEGQGRGLAGDFAHFLMNARGSAYELQTQIELSARLRMVPSASSRQLLLQADEVAKMINGMLRALGKDPEQRALRSKV